MKLPVTIAAARKMEMSLEKFDDARIVGATAPHPPGSYAYGLVDTLRYTHLRNSRYITNIIQADYMVKKMEYQISRKNNKFSSSGLFY